MNDQTGRYIIIGGSAGGLQAVMTILETLDSDFPAPVFVVLHSGSIALTALEAKLSGLGPLPAAYAKDAVPVEAGRVFLAPPNHHMLIEQNRIRLTHGPRINRSRPAIDPMLRSAAVTWGSRTVGVLVCGMLYDGSAGLQAVKRCGGVAIVQDPGDATFAELPENALVSSLVDYVEPAPTIGPLLNRLVAARPNPAVEIPTELVLENRMDLQHDGDIDQMDQLGRRMAVSCPDCGGQLWELSGDEGLPRYRCHTGHSMDTGSMIAGQNKEIEQALWAAVRAMEEKIRVQEKLAGAGGGAANAVVRKMFEERVEESRSHAQRLRRLLLEINNST